MSNVKKSGVVKKATAPKQEEKEIINFGFKDEAIKMVNKDKGFVVLAVNESSFVISTKFAKWDKEADHLNVGIVPEFDYTVRKSDDSEIELSGTELIASLEKNGYEAIESITFDTAALAREL